MKFRTKVSFKSLVYDVEAAAKTESADKLMTRSGREQTEINDRISVKPILDLYRDACGNLVLEVDTKEKTVTLVKASDQ